MKVDVPAGTYVIAVSGGVDSMSLLHQLVQRPNVQLIVAHYDHGMRPDSARDRELVAQAAADYGLQFEFAEGELGAGTSEAKARTARYDFLETVRQQYQADAIITAHHQDDVLETAIINLSRGTGRRGLTSLANTAHFRRPLLDMPKSELLAYAQTHRLKWREDSTNQDQRMLRNYVRHSVLPRFSTADRQTLLDCITKLRTINQALDDGLRESINLLSTAGQLERRSTTVLPCNLTKEVLAAWWRANGFRSYESKTLQRALHDIRACQTGAIIPLKGTYYMTIGRQQLALHNRDR